MDTRDSAFSSPTIDPMDSRQLRAGSVVAARVTFFDSIVWRQLRLSLVLGLAVALLMAMLSVVLDVRSSREQIAEVVERSISASKGSAAEAAYGLNTDLGRKVAEGLLAHDEFSCVELADEAGHTIAHVDRKSSPPRLGFQATSWLLGQPKRITVALHAGAPRIMVGVLAVDIDLGHLEGELIGRAMRSLWIDLLRVALLMASVALVFSRTLGRPLINAVRTLATAARSEEITTPAGHARSELGLLFHQFRGFVQDVELARAQAREALAQAQESEQRFRSLAAVAPVGIYRIDMAGHVRYANAQVDDLLGLSALQHSLRAWLDLVHPEDREALELTRRVAIREGVPLVAECRVVRPDGSLRWLIVKAIRESANEADHGSMVGVFLDISPQKRAEAALRDSERHYRDLFENSPIPLFVLDESERRFLATNHAAVLHYGYTAEQFAGMTLPDLWSPDDRPNRASSLQAPPPLPEGAGNQPERHDRHRCADGRVIEVELTDRQMVWEGRRALLVAVHDVTQRNAALRTIETKNAEMERFTYMVSHDLKSPLVTIRTFVGYLEEDIAKQAQERIAKDLHFIRTAAGKMAQLLDELLQMSRVGRLTDTPTRFSWQSLVSEVLDLVAGHLSQGRVEVVVTPAPIDLFGDRARLAEVLQNLIENAVKFMGAQPSPRVEVFVRGTGRQSVFVVRDNGVGVDPRFHAKVFGLFEKLNAGAEGTGLGLALVKRIVELYEGQVWIESEGLNQGTSLCFTLPTAVRSVDGNAL